MIKVVYDDAVLILVEKPIGLSSEAGDGSLPEALSAYYRDKGERIIPYPVHRLDRAVGGLMVYAKTDRAAAFLSKEIAEHRLEKRYFAVVPGSVTAALGESGELCDLLFKDSKKNKSYVVDKQRKGVKEAKLSYRVVAEKTLEGEVFTLLSVTLFTGRSHQIRLQFSSRGFPLVGDGKYGSRLKGDIALFSAYLAFTHPKTKESLAFSLDLPDRYPFTLF